MSNSQLVEVQVVMPANSLERDQDIEEFDYELIDDPVDREWAESAAGFITFGLGQAVVKVLEAGNLLIEAKRRLAHGQYLPWVEQACGLEPKRAAELIKVAKWAQMSGNAGHLLGVNDATTLFLLSADTTTEEVREWFMEHCAAGKVPTRAEVAERKRSAGQSRERQPANVLALAILRKGELEQVREALALAERAQVVNSEQVMAEQHLREIGKARYIAGLEADFHRIKNGSWIRMPHAGRVDATSTHCSPPKVAASPIAVSGEASGERQDIEVLTIHQAAQLFGMSSQYFQSLLTPGRVKVLGPFVRQGLRVERAGRGTVKVSPV